MAEETYGRGQLEWALWRSFARLSSNTQDTPQIFRTRIKRLLELDRKLDLSDAEEQPKANYAFAPPQLAGSGEVAYRAVDAFCLTIGLDLLDAGFKQAEVVFLMRYLRSELQKRFIGLLAPPSLLSRGRHRAKDYPKLPAYEHRGHKWADRRLFVILKKVELKEIIPAHLRKRHRGPVILEPVFCEGVTALGAKMHDIMPNRRRAVTVLELAATAQAVQAYLADAPVIQRGRPKA